MQSSMPLVTVVLPALNAEHTIAQAISSVLVQTLPDFELLVIDDGSSDCTSRIVSAFRDGRIRLISDGRRLGLARRLNQGIALSSGKYLARMDSDDICFPDRFAKQVEYLETHPSVDLLAARAVAFNERAGAIRILPFRETHEAICARPWLGFYMPHPTWMGRLEWFRKYQYRLPEVLRAEDQELLLRSFDSSRFHCLDEVLLAYREGPIAFRKRLTARLHLMAAQVRVFAAKREPANITRAVAAGLLRICSDLVHVASGTRGAQLNNVDYDTNLKFTQTVHAISRALSNGLQE